MASFTINGKEIHQLDELKEIFNKAYLVLDQAGNSGRFRTGRVSTSTLLGFLSENVFLGDDYLPKDSTFVYATFTKPGTINTNNIFGSFEPIIDYEVVGLNIYADEGPNGVNPNSKLAVRLYDYENQTGIGEVGKISVNTNKVFKRYSDPVTLFNGRKYGVIVTDASSAAPIEDVNVQMVLKTAANQTTGSEVLNTTSNVFVNTVASGGCPPVIDIQTLDDQDYTFDKSTVGGTYEIYLSQPRTITFDLNKWEENNYVTIINRSNEDLNFAITNGLPGASILSEAGKTKNNKAHTAVTAIYDGISVTLLGNLSS